MHIRFNTDKHKHLPLGNEFLCGHRTDDDNHQWKIMKMKFSFIQILQSSNWNNSWWQFECTNTCRCKLMQMQFFFHRRKKKHTYTESTVWPTHMHIAQTLSRHTKTHTYLKDLIFSLSMFMLDEFVSLWLCSVKTLVCGLLKSPQVETMDGISFSSQNDCENKKNQL